MFAQAQRLSGPDSCAGARHPPPVSSRCWPQEVALGEAVFPTGFPTSALRGLGTASPSF